MNKATVPSKTRMRTPQAAEYLGLAASTLDKMRSEGRGPRFLRLGGRIFYRNEDLDAFLAACLVETENSRAAA
jgi:predicted DNA-binding transcriptional regulator AlpA